jgi:peptide/nickel transport system substrate-binding protein
VPWLSLVTDNDIRLVRRALIQMRDQNAFPAGPFKVGDKTFVSAQDAKARADAAVAWIDKYNLAVIGNGPFQLVRYDPPAQFAEVLAFRDPSYPYKPGSWYRGTTPAVAVTSVNAPRVGIGSAATVRVRVEGPGETGLRYAVVDPAAKKVVTSGQASKSGDEYAVEIPANVTQGLSPGFYQLSLLAYSDRVSSLGERTVDLEVATGQTVERTPTGAGGTATPTPARTGGGFSCSAPAKFRTGK